MQIIKPFILLVIIASLLSSCSITKCRYSNGLKLELGLCKRQVASDVPTLNKQRLKRHKVMDSAIQLVHASVYVDAEQIVKVAASDTQKLQPVFSHSILTTSKSFKRSVASPLKEQHGLAQQVNNSFNTSSAKMSDPWWWLDLILVIPEYPLFSLAFLIAVFLMYLLLFKLIVGLTLIYQILIALGGYTLLTIALGLFYQFLGMGPATDVYKVAAAIIFGGLLLVGLVVLIILGGGFYFK
ncbi:MAG: hypothetical protein Q8K70_04435 [Bacteroidota bacterium]|nr:hypothetical protein [Bacteroidota bacterium]